MQKRSKPDHERIVLREHQIGDIGWVVHRQGRLYAEEFGWDGSFEALVAEIAAKFLRKFDAQHERCWIAERDGKILGSVFLVRQSKRVAKLRLLYVDPEARGLGLGARLTDECIQFARAKNYRTLRLWTNDVLIAARQIYVAAGFKLVAEEAHHSFGKDLIGETWELHL
jgi:GNAT superfamily N-acetyltransferase